MTKRKQGVSHLFIPDTQVKPGVPLDHLKALGNYIVDQKPDVIIHIGDHWDMPSLNSYEKKHSAYFHDKTYKEDIEAGIEGMDYLLGPLRKMQARSKRNKKKGYNPRLVFTVGNHEYRIARAIHEDPRLKGTIGFQDLKLEEMGWEVYPFLHIAEIDGILYSHYFVNPDSLKKNPVGGTIENKLRIIGHSFSQGHQQTFQFGMRHDGLGRPKMGLTWGTFYMHDEDYLGPQGNARVDGVMIKHEVKDGAYLPMAVSMKYLLENWL